MYVDCWAGNGGRLVRYVISCFWSDLDNRGWDSGEMLTEDRFYEAQGFQKIDGFVVEKADGQKWPGMFLRMDLGKKFE
jgi:hypothetical protein